MGKFLHNPDNWITIEDDSGNSLTLMMNEFVQYEPSYTGVPAPYIGRTYVQDVSHILYTSNTQFAGDMPWKPGEMYIANLATYQKDRLAKQNVLLAQSAQAALTSTTSGLLAALEWFINYAITKNIVSAADVPPSILALLKKRTTLQTEATSAESQITSKG